MKPNKQNAKSGTTKKNSNENKSVPKIGNFFKSAPKSFAIVDKNNTEHDGTKALYIQMLKKKLQNGLDERCAKERNGACAVMVEDGGDDVVMVEDGGDDVAMVEDGGEDVHSNQTQDPCASQIVSKCAESETAVQNSDWEMKFKALQKRYAKLAIRFSELELKYGDLLKLKTHDIEFNTEDLMVRESDDVIFSRNELQALRNMPLEKKKDSTFILQSLKYAYKNDLSVLNFKTLTGKTETVKIYDDGIMEEIPAKNPLTPKKVVRIRDLYIERIAKCKIDSVEYNIRIKDSRINQLFASGIRNVAKMNK